MILELAERTLASRLYAWDREALAGAINSNFDGLRRVTSRPAANLLIEIDGMVPSEQREIAEIQFRGYYSNLLGNVADRDGLVQPLSDEEASLLVRFRQACAKNTFAFDLPEIADRTYPFEYCPGISPSWSRRSIDRQKALWSSACGELLRSSPRISGHSFTYKRILGDWTVFTTVKMCKLMDVCYVLKRNDDPSDLIFIEGAKPHLTFDYLGKFGLSTNGWTVDYNDYYEESMAEYERLMDLFWAKVPEFVAGLGLVD